MEMYRSLDHSGFVFTVLYRAFHFLADGELAVPGLLELQLDPYRRELMHAPSFLSFYLDRGLADDALKRFVYADVPAPVSIAVYGEGKFDVSASILDACSKIPDAV